MILNVYENKNEIDDYIRHVLTNRVNLICPKCECSNVCPKNNILN